MTEYWILKGKTPVPADFMEWAAWFEDVSNRRVASSVLAVNDEDVTVSTIFLGLDHSFGSGDKPLLFETLVMGGALDQEMTRTATWDKAIATHEKMVALVKEGRKR